MDDAEVVGRTEALGRFEQDLQRFANGERTLAVDALAGRLALHHLHDQVVQAVVFGDIEDADHVLVVDARGRLPLAAEAGDELWIVGDERWLQTLDRDVDVEIQVMAAIDRTHAALADLRVDHARRQHLVAGHLGDLAQ
jgi:hypothetical protein